MNHNLRGKDVGNITVNYLRPLYLLYAEGESVGKNVLSARNRKGAGAAWLE